MEKEGKLASTWISYNELAWTEELLPNPEVYVVIPDCIDYMVSEEDLSQAITNNVINVRVRFQRSYLKYLELTIVLRLSAVQFLSANFLWHSGYIALNRTAENCVKSRQIGT